MKIRQGFVSNSSNTSFMIYGVVMLEDFDEEIDIEKFKDYFIDVMKEEKIKHPTLIESLDEEIRGLESIERLEEIEHGISDIMSKSELIVIQDPFDGYIYIGESPTEAPDHMTVGDWKSEVKEELKKMGIKDKPGWIRECWRDV